MNFVLTPLKLVLGLVGVFWLFFAGIAYVVYLPAGWPNYKVALWTIHAPWAGEVQGARAQAAWNKAQWTQCQANERTEKTEIDLQNASIQALSDAGSRAAAEADKAVSDAQGRLEAAIRARVSISAPLPAGNDVCAAAKVVDQRFTEALR